MVKETKNDSLYSEISILDKKKRIIFGVVYSPSNLREESSNMSYKKITNIIRKKHSAVAGDCTNPSIQW